MGKRRHRVPVEHFDDRQLLEAAAKDDVAAARELYQRSASASWGLALVVCGTPATAADAVVHGFVHVMADLRSGALPVHEPFKPHALAAARTAASEARVRLGDTLDELLAALPADGDAADAIITFADLPEAWRSALWLSDVVLLPDDQLGIPLGLSTEDAAALEREARAGFNENLADRMAARTDDEVCRLVTQHLSKLLTGDLDDVAAEAAEDHLGDCNACRARRAALVGSNAHLAALVGPLPADLQSRAITAWQEDAKGATAPTPEEPTTAAEVTVDKVDEPGVIALAASPRPDDAEPAAAAVAASGDEVANDDVAQGGDGASSEEPDDAPVVAAVGDGQEAGASGADGADADAGEPGDGQAGDESAEEGDESEHRDEPKRVPAMAGVATGAGLEFLEGPDKTRWERASDKFTAFERRHRMVAVAAAILLLIGLVSLTFVGSSGSSSDQAGATTTTGRPAQFRYGDAKPSTNTTLPDVDSLLGSGKSRSHSGSSAGVGAAGTGGSTSTPTSSGALPAPSSGTSSGGTTGGTTGSSTGGGSPSGGGTGIVVTTPSGGGGGGGGSTPTTSAPTPTPTTARHCVTWLIPPNPLLRNGLCGTWSS